MRKQAIEKQVKSDGAIGKNRKKTGNTVEGASWDIGNQ